MEIKTFFDARTFTLTYVVFDAETRDALVIDPVLDYDPAASKTYTESVDEVITYLKKNELTLHYILETHAHADHLSGSQMLKEAFPEAKIAIGENIRKVQKVFKMVFDLPADFPVDGSQFDELLPEGDDVAQAGSLSVGVINTPGHTPACVTFKIGDAIFTGDALFMPDSGTGRCDFPGGSSKDMYDSIANKIYALPDDLDVYVGHDYQPGGREVKWVAKLGEHKDHNVALDAKTTEEDYVQFRDARDATLNAPKLLFQSVQVNVDAGRLPDPHANEIRYLKIPINVFRPEAAPKAGSVTEEEASKVARG